MHSRTYLSKVAAMVSQEVVYTNCLCDKHSSETLFLKKEIEFLNRNVKQHLDKAPAWAFRLFCTATLESAVPNGWTHESR